MIIDKSDFSTYVNFTVNIESRILDFHINDAQELDFVPRVPAAFYTAIQVVSSPAIDVDSFRQNFVVPLLVCFAYKRFLLWQGRSITQYGIRQINEDTSTEISDKSRAELINDIKSKCNVYLTRFYNELKALDYTLNGVTYSFDLCDKKKISTIIRAV